MLSLLPKDIVWLIDGILHRHRLDIVLDEYRMLVTRSFGGSVHYYGLTYNYRSYDEIDEDEPLYDRRCLKVAVLPRNY